MTIKIQATARLKVMAGLKFSKAEYQKLVLGFLADYMSVPLAELKKVMLKTKTASDLQFSMSKPMFSALKKATAKDEGSRMRDGCWLSGSSVGSGADAFQLDFVGIPDGENWKVSVRPGFHSKVKVV